MGKAVNIEIDAHRLNGALRELSRLTGKDFRTVVRHETGKILEGAAKRTDMATVASIKENHEAQPVTTIAGKIYFLNNRYPDAVWAKIQSFRAKRLKEKLAARGLARKVWLQIAQQLGIEIKVAGQVVKATTPKGDYPQDASGSEAGSGSAFTIIGTSLRTYAPGIVGALAGAMRGRLVYFRRNLKTGVFLKAKEIARKYPGLYVNGN